MRTIATDSELLDEATEIFLNDPDQIEAADQWMRGFLSDQAYLERSQFLKQIAFQKAHEKILGRNSDEDMGEGRRDLAQDEHETLLVGA